MPYNSLRNFTKKGGDNMKAVSEMSCEEIQQLNRRLVEIKVLCGRECADKYLELLLEGVEGAEFHRRWLIILKEDERRREKEETESGVCFRL